MDYEMGEDRLMNRFPFVLSVVLVLSLSGCTKRSEEKVGVPGSSPLPTATQALAPSTETPSAEEAVWISKYPKFLARSGNLLTLTFSNGKKREFETKRGSSYETYHVVSVKKFHPEPKLVELHHGYYEGESVELISMATGDSIRLEGSNEILWSPKRRYFVWTNADESSFSEPQVLIGSCSAVENGTVCKPIYDVKKEGGKATWKPDESEVEIALLMYDSDGKSDWVEKGRLVCRLAPEKVDCSETKK
jgi:hypothetical protein